MKVTSTSKQQYSFTTTNSTVEVLKVVKDTITVSCPVGSSSTTFNIDYPTGS